jgi:hypothetical protein
VRDYVLGDDAMGPVSTMVQQDCMKAFLTVTDALVKMCAACGQQLIDASSFRCSSCRARTWPRYFVASTLSSEALCLRPHCSWPHKVLPTVCDGTLCDYQPSPELSLAAPSPCLNCCP